MMPRMLTWIIIGLLALVTGGFVAARVNRPRRVQPQLPGTDGHAGLLERTLKDVRPNDVVQHGGHDFLVEGVIQYDEDGHGWRLARMMDGGNETWLLAGL